MIIYSKYEMYPLNYRVTLMGAAFLMSIIITDILALYEFGAVIITKWFFLKYFGLALLIGIMYLIERWMNKKIYKSNISEFEYNS